MKTEPRKFPDIDRRADKIDLSGPPIIPNTFIGKDKTINDLFSDGYGSIFVGVGVGVDAPMRAEVMVWRPTIGV